MTLNLRQTSGNAIALLTSDAMNRATSFVLYALVARYLGAHEFGQLTLALTLFYTFQVFAVAGLKILITRQVAKDRSETGIYFTNACVIVAFSSICSLATLSGFLHLMHYTHATSLVILLLSLSLFPYAFSAICEGIFQAWEHMRYIPLVNVPVNIAKIGCALLLLSRGHGLYAIILILLLSQVAIAGVEAWILFHRFPKLHSPFNPRFSLNMVRSASTFLGIDGILAATGSLNIILLSKVANETQVGLFNAALQLMAPLLLVYQSISLSILPVMSQKVEPGFRSLRQISESAIELLLVVAVPTVAALFFIGDWVLSILYKNPAFVQAFPALRIIVWVLILQVFTSVLGQALVASHHEKVNLTAVVVGTVVNLLVGWPLISHFGLRGAALTVLVTKVADFWLHYVPVSRLFSGIWLGKIMWEPIAAGACMAVYLVIVTGRAVVRGFRRVDLYQRIDCSDYLGHRPPSPVQGHISLSVVRIAFRELDA
jgi:O-antigen/teichoic acid export membrane protein